jgi:putative transposase
MANGWSKAAREQAEQRRLAAAELFAQRVPQAEVARRLGVSAQAVCVWHRRWGADGVDGLRRKRAPGFQSWLTDDQLAELTRVLTAGAQASGFDGGWTLARVATVIRHRFGVRYRYPSGVWKLLHRIGFTAQRPARRAVERDQDAVNAWREHTWSQVVEAPGPAGHGSVAPTSRA